MRDPLFSVHTTDSGAVCLYLEEQDACVDLVEAVLNFNDIEPLDALRVLHLPASKKMALRKRLIKRELSCLIWLSRLP